MKPGYAPIIVILLCLMLLSCGCTQEQKEPAPATPVQTPVPATSVPSVPDNPYPDAFTPGREVAFGTADMTGTATVTRYSIKPFYNWTSPSWRSTRQMNVYTGKDKVQTDYNAEIPAQDTVFLFVFFRVTGTGTQPVYAPSPDRIIVVGDRKTYRYSTVADSGVLIDGVSGSQYDFHFGDGGTGGYVRPGLSNAAEGYLIYEIPANLAMDRTYVLASLDYKTTAEWKLA